jgi:hypothetical protein
MLRQLSFVLLALALAGCGEAAVSLDATCVPGAAKCDAAGAKVVVCSNDGTNWILDRYCAAGQFCTNGACLSSGPQAPGSDAFSGFSADGAAGADSTGDAEAEAEVD